jgi:hypothetical protein
VDSADVALRNRTYRRFVELGRAPTAAEMAASEGVDVADVLSGWRRLHDAHALVLDADAKAIRMANPFSAVETSFRVSAGGRSWFANCGWDAFGIGVTLRADSSSHTTCPDCGDRIDLDVRGYRPAETSAIFHVLVPAAEWWSDIGFT